VHDIIIWILICVLACVHEVGVILHACIWTILYALLSTYVYIMYMYVNYMFLQICYIFVVYKNVFNIQNVYTFFLKYMHIQVIVFVPNCIIQTYIVSLLPKWGAIYYLKSLWYLKSEITSLHFTNFTIISLCRHHVSLLLNIIHYYNLL
jgi:hypothetical protein